MAVTTSTVYASVDKVVIDVIFGANGDVASGNIAHGLLATPDDVQFCPRVQSATLQDWAWAVDATNLTVTKTLATGTATLRFVLRRSLHNLRG